MAEAIWYPSPNHSHRAGRHVQAVVVHTTAGTWPTDRGWLCNPASKVSAHEIVDPTGQVWQLVAADRAAWANGIIQRPNLVIPIVMQWDNTPQHPDWPAGLPNLESYSIEVSGVDSEHWTAAQWGSLRVRVLRAVNWFQLGRDRVIRHGDIDGVDRPNCPMPAGKWGEFVNELFQTWEGIGPGLQAAMRRAGDVPRPGAREHYLKAGDGAERSYVAGERHLWTWVSDGEMGGTVYRDGERV